MKLNLRRFLSGSIAAGILLSFFSVIVLMTSCKNINESKSTDHHIKREKSPNSRMTDIKGAMEYEFNMIKDPATGKIPEGIRDAELAQAHEILARQRLAGRMEAENAYMFQGPNNLGGRTRGLAYDVRNGTTNSVIMAGGVSGGIFKSTDDGASWVRKNPTGDLFNVTALAQDTRSSPATAQDTWYYAGGEFTGNSASEVGASYRGKGVYKSADNGETWTHLPASNTGVYESFDHRADYVYRLVV